MDWMVDPSTQEMLSEASSLLAIELRKRSDGYDRLDLSWKLPGWTDLSPDVEYRRSDSEAQVRMIVDGKGARASIFAPSDKRGPTFLERLLIEPALACCSESDASAINSLAWIPTDVQDKLVVPLKLDKNLPLVRSFFQGDLRQASPFRHGGGQRLLASHNDGSNVVRCLGGFDYTLVDDQQEGRTWEGESRSSFRVLEWQLVETTNGHRLLIPHVAVWEQDILRPKMPEKSVRRRCLAIVSVYPKSDIALHKWEELLPRIRIADLRSGLAKTVVTPLDRCLVHRVMKQFDATGGRLRSLASSDLVGKWQASFQQLIPSSVGLREPVSDLARNSGIMRKTASFQAFSKSDEKAYTQFVSAGPKNENSIGKQPELVKFANLLRFLGKKVEAPRSIISRTGYRDPSEGESNAAKRSLAVLWGIGFLGFASIVASLTRNLIFTDSKVAQLHNR
jgi:hypothetical protein